MCFYSIPQWKKLPEGSFGGHPASFLVSSKSITSELLI
jgi:hypothetical protein